MSADFYSHVSNGEFVKALRCVPLDVAARSLSQQCRYNGTTSKFYSVAQHCVLVSSQWKAGDPRAVWGLLHDLHETVIGDITKPARDKLLWKVGDLVYSSDELERMLLGQIQKRFGLDPIPADVLQADNLIVTDEMFKLFHAPNIPRRRRRLGIEIVPMPPERAETLFLQRAWQLGVDELFNRSQR